MKKVLFIGVPLLLIIGTVLGLGFFGIIKIPYITRVKKAKPTAAVAKAKAPPPVVPPKAETKAATKVVDKTPPTDETAGNKKLAKLWGDLDAAKLQPIVADWKDQDLAKVLVLMDSDKVGELLASMPAPKASKLSRAIQKEAAKPKPQDTGL